MGQSRLQLPTYLNHILTVSLGIIFIRHDPKFLRGKRCCLKHFWRLTLVEMRMRLQPSSTFHRLETSCPSRGAGSSCSPRSLCAQQQAFPGSFLELQMEHVAYQPAHCTTDKMLPHLGCKRGKKQWGRGPSPGSQAHTTGCQACKATLRVWGEGELMPSLLSLLSLVLWSSPVPRRAHSCLCHMIG